MVFALHLLQPPLPFVTQIRGHLLLVVVGAVPLLSPLQGSSLVDSGRSDVNRHNITGTLMGHTVRVSESCDRFMSGRRKPQNLEYYCRCSRTRGDKVPVRVASTTFSSYNYSIKTGILLNIRPQVIVPACGSIIFLIVFRQPQVCRLCDSSAQGKDLQYPHIFQLLYV